jgi:hypothetical protein
MGAGCASPPTDGFVGRSAELQRIADLLGRDECRLLCLIGPGGVGKTRLARRTMQELAPRYADGAVFVPLEDVDTPAQLGLRIAREGGVAAGRATTTRWRGSSTPGARRSSCCWCSTTSSSLPSTPAFSIACCRTCARLKIVVTSRLRLAVAGEWSMPIEGLPFPEPEDEDRAESFDAVRLFVRRGRGDRAGLRRGREVARDRRRLPPGRGTCRWRSSSRRLGADAAVPGDRRRVAHGTEAAARRRHAPPAAPRQHRGGVSSTRGGA